MCQLSLHTADMVERINVGSPAEVRQVLSYIVAMEATWTNTEIDAFQRAITVRLRNIRRTVDLMAAIVGPTLMVESFPAA
jgi:hypothetical protein